MPTRKLIERNPFDALFRTLGDGREQPFGVVFARAGVGKTALLVQLALSSMLHERRVLHVSIGEPITKVKHWYRELFAELGRTYAQPQVGRQWDELLGHRFIMTFMADGFGVPTLKERLLDLREQGIFTPHMLLVDGFPFEQRDDLAPLAQLKRFASEQGLAVWFAVRSHRHLNAAEDELPATVGQIADLFDLAVQLRPGRNEVQVELVRGAGEESTPLSLDPGTFLIV